MPMGHWQSRVSSRPTQSTVVALTLLIAWPVVTFGGVYPWTYVPLLAGATLFAAVVLVGARGQLDTVRPLFAPLLAVGAAIGIQTIPLPRPLLQALSPAVDQHLFEWDVAYSTAVTLGQSPWHALSLDPASTLLALLFYLVLAALLCAATVALSSGGVRRLLRNLLLLAALIAALAIVQDRTFNGKLWWFWTPLYGSANAFGPFVNRNHFAGWMVMAVFAGLGLLMSESAALTGGVRKGWRNRLLWLGSPDANRLTLMAGALMLMSVALVWPVSRSGIVGLVGASAVAIIWVGRTRTGVVHRLVAAGVCAMLLMVPLSRRGSELIAARFAETANFSGRVDTWRDSMVMARDFPVFGVGINAYSAGMRQYQSDRRDGHMAEAHNDYVELLASGGLLVTVPALFAAIRVLREIKRRVTEPATGHRYWLRVGAVIGLVGIGVQEAAEFSLQKPANAVLAVILMAIAMHRSSPRSLGGAT